MRRTTIPDLMASHAPRQPIGPPPGIMHDVKRCWPGSSFGHIGGSVQQMPGKSCMPHITLGGSTRAHEPPLGHGGSIGRPHLAPPFTHSPSDASPTPACLRRQSFQYDTPSHPHTAPGSFVQEMGRSSHSPGCPQADAQYSLIAQSAGPWHAPSIGADPADPAAPAAPCCSATTTSSPSHAVANNSAHQQSALRVFNVHLRVRTRSTASRRAARALASATLRCHLASPARRDGATAARRRRPTA